MRSYYAIRGGHDTAPLLRTCRARAQVYAQVDVRFHPSPWRIASRGDPARGRGWETVKTGEKKKGLAYTWSSKPDTATGTCISHTSRASIFKPLCIRTRVSVRLKTWTSHHISTVAASARATCDAAFAASYRSFWTINFFFTFSFLYVPT